MWEHRPQACISWRWAPRLAMPHSSTSPTAMYRFLPKPTPGGVPIARRSPGEADSLSGSREHPPFPSARARIAAWNALHCDDKRWLPAVHCEGTASLISGPSAEARWDVTTRAISPTLEKPTAPRVSADEVGRRCISTPFPSLREDTLAHQSAIVVVWRHSPKFCAKLAGSAPCRAPAVNFVRHVRIEFLEAVHVTDGRSP